MQTNLYVLLQEVQARQAMLTFVLQQADNNVIAADSRVEPVVITSSINKICFDTKYQHL
jgi:hypothetical protein